MLIKTMTLLFFLSSCALFKEQPSIENKNKEELLKAVKLTGEGRGRVSLSQNQYVFGFDSLLKENYDWVLAVQIPLHGEEALILPDLKQKNLESEEMYSFEERIKKDFVRLKLDKILTPQAFIRELRSLIRFNLSPAWGGKRICTAQESDLLCQFDGETFLITTNKRELSVIKSLGEGKNLVLDAKNLTESFFTQTDIRLYSNEANRQNKKAAFSLELFWKN